MSDTPTHLFTEDELRERGTADKYEIDWEPAPEDEDAVRPVP